MEGSGAVTVSVEVGAPSPTAAPGAAPGIPSAPASPNNPPLAATGAPVDVLVSGAVSLILLGAVAVAATRTRLEHFRA